MKKGDFYNAFPAIKGVYNTHNAIDKSIHGRKRRVLSQAFSEQALKGMEDVMLLNIRQFCSIMGGDEIGLETKSTDSQKGPVIRNMTDWFAYLTYDVMGELCFGKSFGMLIERGRRDVINLVDRAAFRHYVVCYTIRLLDGYSRNCFTDDILFSVVCGCLWIAGTWIKCLFAN